VTLALNLALFQVGWFACVLGAARGLSLLGPVTVAAILAWHAVRSQQPAQELKLVALAVVFGAIFDSALAALGWIDFAPVAAAPYVAPWWMLALWAVFATTVNVSLSWLRLRLRLAALLGAVGGPFAYWAGERLGALELREPAAAFAALGAAWALVLPALLTLGRRLDGATR
jgi:hypothetical protein